MAAFRKAELLGAGPYLCCEGSSIRLSGKLRQARKHQGLLALSAVKEGCRRAVQWYISLRTLTTQEGVNQYWFPIGIWQLRRPESCGEEQARIPLENSLLSVGTDVVPGTTLFWILSYKGKGLPEIWFRQTAPHQAVDFPILVLKCDERCHRRP